MKRLLAVCLAVLFVAAPLVAQPAATYRATLSWVDNSDNEDGFRVERSMNVLPRFWNEVGSVGIDVISFVDEPLLPSDDFCWQVVAFNGAGNSLPSTEACAAVPTTPAAPGGLTVVITQVP